MCRSATGSSLRAIQKERDGHGEGEDGVKRGGKGKRGEEETTRLERGSRFDQDANPRKCRALVADRQIACNAVFFTGRTFAGGSAVLQRATHFSKIPLPLHARNCFRT